ncbi:hypothetical protein L289_4117 [Acinetobacter gerneri DSM 14967 = CIP 107464 = MTCC 9824]|nr:hypothetical protein L289_4117 [Acinetobacter gerneri DSM 14967 = CIP 107464 = MTCC 9824]
MAVRRVPHRLDGLEEILYGYKEIHHVPHRLDGLEVTLHPAPLEV